MIGLNEFEYWEYFKTLVPSNLFGIQRQFTPITINVVFLSVHTFPANKGLFLKGNRHNFWKQR